MSAYQEDWDVGRAQHLVGNAAQDPPPGPRAAVTGHHDQVDGVLVDVVDDRLCRGPRFHDCADDDGVRRRVLRERFQVLKGAPFYDLLLLVYEDGIGRGACDDARRWAAGCGAA